MPNINTPPQLRRDRASGTTRGPPSSFIPGTNAIESLNARLRRAVNARGHFPTELHPLLTAVAAMDCARRPVAVVGGVCSSRRQYGMIRIDADPARCARQEDV
jgi:hypothetical protein